jgi:hypothetical protein
MRRELKKLLLWLVLLALLRLTFLLPHRHYDDLKLINTGLQILVCILCIDISRHLKRAEKHLFTNYAISFGFVLPLFVTNFVGETLFMSSPYSTFYYHLYVNKIGLGFFILMPLVYTFLDVFYAHTKTAIKYLISISCSAVVVYLLFYKFIFSPFQLYNEPEYSVVEQLNSHYVRLSNELGKEPTDQELTSAFNQAGVKDASILVASLKPYLGNRGLTTLFWKPVDTISIYANAIALALVIILLYSMYRNNMPYYAYLDKILVILGLLSLLDIVHYIGYMKSFSDVNYQLISVTGQYFTILCLLIMVYGLDLKLRFTQSATGKYYEEALATEPEKITIWKDEIDTLILKLFFKRKQEKLLALTNKEQK